MTIGDARSEIRSEEFRIGRVVSRTLDILFAYPATFLILSALLSVPSVFLGYCLVKVRAAEGTQMAGFGYALGVSTLEMMLIMILGCLEQAALTKAAISSLNDERPGIVQSLSTMMNNFLPLAAIGILMALGFILGAALLIVPFIILMVMWTVVVPVKVVEDIGVIEVFSRSRALTREYRWRIFLLLLVYILVVGGADLLTHLALGIGLVIKPADFTILYAAVDWIGRTVITGITAVATASIYYELRLVKEGIGDQQMAAAFD